MKAKNPNIYKIGSDINKHTKRSARVLQRSASTVETKLFLPS